MRFAALDFVGLNVASTAGSRRLVCAGGCLAGVQALSLSTSITSAGEGSFDTAFGLPPFCCNSTGR